MGSYVDVTFRDPARNADAQALIELATAILGGVRVSEKHHVAFRMVVQRLKLFFGLPDRYALDMRPQGYGRSASEAWRAFDHAVFATALAIANLQKT